MDERDAPPDEPRASVRPRRETHRRAARERAGSTTSPRVAPVSSVSAIHAVVARRESAAAVADEADEALREGRDEDAYGAALTCLDRDPDEVRCLRAAAVALARTERFDEARDYVDRCLERASGATCDRRQIAMPARTRSRSRSASCAAA